MDKNENFVKLSRTDALKENDRIQFENGSVVGSISLKGAAIDDLTFKEYNVELNGTDKITLLSPRNVEDGYLIDPCNAKDMRKEQYEILSQYISRLVEIRTL